MHTSFASLRLKGLRLEGCHSESACESVLELEVAKFELPVHISTPGPGTASGNLNARDNRTSGTGEYGAEKQRTLPQPFKFKLFSTGQVQVFRLGA